MEDEIEVPEQEAPRELTADDWRKRALSAEREAKERKERLKQYETARREDLKTRFSVADEDLDGLPLLRVEALLSKVVGSKPASEAAPTEPTPEPAEIEAAKAFTAHQGASGIPPKDAVPFTDLRAQLKAGKVSWGEVSEMVRQGRVEGVTPPK